MKKNIDKIYAEALFAATAKATEEEIGKKISKFLELLKTKSVLYRIDKIIKEYEKIYNRKNSIASLKIKSAHTLDTKSIQAIAAKLGLEKYEVEIMEDTKLLGGFTARYNDVMIDASIKNNINKLHKKLIS